MIFKVAQQMSGAQAERFLLTVSRVGRHWRNVALSSPFLWTNIDIRPWLELDVIRLQLDRSKSHPIDLKLVALVREDFSEFPPFDVDGLCKIITPHISHCRSITFSGEFDYGDDIMVRLLAGFRDVAAPRLERLSLRWAGGGWEEVEVADLPIFSSGAPMLTDVRLGGFGFSYTPPLSHVTALYLNRYGADFDIFPYRRFCQMAAACPLLVKLALYDKPLADLPSVDSPDQFCNIPTLRSLQIYGRSNGLAELLLISAPDLEELLLVPTVPYRLERISSRYALESPKFPQLKSLILIITKTDNFNMATAYQCFPTIETLTLAGAYNEQYPTIFADRQRPILWLQL